MKELKSTFETEFIKPEKTALVVIDLQQGIAGRREISPYTGEQVIQNASKLANEFAQKGAFVVLVRVSTTDGKDMVHPKTDSQMDFKFQEGWDIIVPELAKIKNTHVITKKQWGAFYGTDLDLQLRRRGIDTIVLCGISTGIGVDTTAREAFEHGYNQIFVEDAMSAVTKEEHDYVSKYIFPKIGKVRTSEEVVNLFA